MARQPVDRQTAASVVQDSLGLSADDLGMDREDPFEGLNFDDEGHETEGDDNDELDAGDDDTGVDELDARPQRRQQEEEPRQPRQRQDQDYLSVTHTPKPDEFDIKKVKYDGKGNILSADGKTVVAKAGREARMFTSLHKTRDRLNTVQQRANGEITRLDTNLKKAVEIGTGLAQQLTTLREAGTAHTRAGISDHEHQQALELASMWKRSPIDAVKTMLTRAAASGIDLTTLGLQPGGFDTKALLDLVRSELGTATKPIQDRNQAETAAQQVERQTREAGETATRELNQFLIQNPDAQRYLPVFERIYSRPEYQNMTLNEVWLRIQLNLARQSREPRDQNRDPNAQRLRNRQQPRLPNGRQNPPDGRRGRQQSDDIAPVSESYESIARSVLGM